MDFISASSHLMRTCRNGSIPKKRSIVRLALDTDTHSFITHHSSFIILLKNSAKFCGSIVNTKLIINLPDGCCVEVPCLVNRAGLQPCYVGALPPQCAALCQSNVNMQGLTVRAILDGKREHAYHAAMLDPNTAAQLTLPQIRMTIDRLLDAQGDLMPPLD